MALLTHAQHDKELQAISRKLNHWMEKTLGSNFRRFCPGEAWVPAVNVYETKDNYYVVVDLSGVDGQKIDIRVDEDKALLVISGSRELPPPAPKGHVKLLLMEIDHGAFCRSLDLPANADVEGIGASYKCGLLTITLPKK